METPQRREPADRERISWLGLGLVLLVGLLDARSMGYDFVTWDDAIHVTENAAVLSPGSVPLFDHLLTPYLGYPIPLTILSYHANAVVHGMAPAGYHAVNVALQMANVVLIFLCALQLGARPVLAAAGTALFAVHPATVEVVAWVTGRKDLLAVEFLLGSLLIQLRRTDLAGRALALALLACSLLSKPAAVAMPVALLLVDMLFHRQTLRRALPYTAAAAALSGTVAAASIVFELQLGGVVTSLSFSQWVRNIADAGAVHLLHAFVPICLLPKYAEASRHGLPLRDLAVCAAAAGLSGLIALGFRKTQPALTLAIVWIALAYLPVSSVLPLTRHVADTYLYMPLVGVVWLVSCGLSKTPRPGWAALAIASVWLLAIPVRLATLENWRNSVALWGATAQRFDDSPRFCRALANAYVAIFPETDRETLRPDLAIATHLKCIERTGQSQIYAKSLGIVYAQTGRRELALRYFIEAQRHDPSDPVVWEYLQELR